jgi:hypothetical protein
MDDAVAERQVLSEGGASLWRELSLEPRPELEGAGFDPQFVGHVSGLSG